MGSSCSQIKEEFTVEKLKLTHEPEREFVESPWQCFRPMAFAVYRLVLAILLFGYTTFDIVWECKTIYPQMPAYWLIYGTNLILLLFFVACLYLAILALIRNCRSEYDPEGPVNSYSGAWILYLMSTNIIMVATLIYWMGLSSSGFAVFTSESSMAKNIIPITLIVIDINASTIPVRLCHAIYPIALGLVYCLCLFVYSLAGGKGPNGKEVYPSLTWTSVQGSIMAPILTICLGILSQAVLYAFCVFRDFLREFGESPVLADFKGDSQSHSSGSRSASQDQHRGSPSSVPGEKDFLPGSSTAAKRKSYSSINK